jgi:SAM-dependent methyltransferase
MLGQMSTQLTALLACPSCRADLKASPGGFVCSKCGRSYPSNGGVPDLVGKTFSQAPMPGVIGRAVESIVATPAVYDFVQRLAGAESVIRRIRPVLAQMEGAIVLDAGAGTGSLEAHLPSSAQYLWLDTDPQKLAGFRKRSTTPAILGDATRIPLRDRSVDWAVSIGVSHHLDDDGLRRMLDELRRVARGRLLFLDPVLTSKFTSRLLWRYDRGRHPRGAADLRRELAARFSIDFDEEFTVRHRYLLVTAM